MKGEMEGRGEFSELPYDVIQRLGVAISPRLQPGEDLDDVLAGAVQLGLRRAALFGRPVIPPDVEFSLTLWCWWPFKPELDARTSDLLHDVRQRLFAGASERRGIPDPLMTTVPDEVLGLSLEQLYLAQRSEGWIATWL